MILQAGFIIILVCCSVFHNLWLILTLKRQEQAMTPSTFKKYAKEAGFSKIDVLPVKHFIWEFYRLAQ